MSYLTRILLNPHRRNAQRILSNPHNAHGAVLACFPPNQRQVSNDGARILWRLDENAHSHTLWITSPTQPDCSHLVESAGWVTEQAETRNLAKLFDKLETGQHWGYVLLANPTKAALNIVTQSPEGSPRRGKRVGLIKPTEQLEWLRRKGEQHGFVLPEEQIFVPQIQQRERKLRKKNHNVTLNLAKYTGLLKVDDPDLLIRALRNGIGGGKAYGAGMLSLFSPNKVIG